MPTATSTRRHGHQLDDSGGRPGARRRSRVGAAVLGDVAGKDVLEFGCGAAQWSIALAKAGARPVGLDISARQLEHARRLMAEAGVDFPLVEASAEDVPLPDASFDIVFCDHGAMTFADPYRTVPEVARLLRPGGLFAFNHASPIEAIAWAPDAEHAGDRLVLDYFGMHALDEGDVVIFQLPYGEWIRLFRANGFTVEDLIEPRPAADATSSYRDAGRARWARRWPSESIWRLRRALSLPDHACRGSTSRTTPSPGPSSRSSASRTRSRQRSSATTGLAVDRDAPRAATRRPRVARPSDEIGLPGLVAWPIAAEGTVDIHRLVVAPRAFRRGIATTLLDALDALYPGRPTLVSTGRGTFRPLTLYLGRGFAIAREREAIPGLLVTELSAPGPTRNQMGVGGVGRRRGDLQAAEPHPIRGARPASRAARPPRPGDRRRPRSPTARGRRRSARSVRPRRSPARPG